MRVAVVHEWLETYAGSERVLEQILALFPDADVFALVDFMPAKQRDFLGGRSVSTTFIQKLPFARRIFRNFLPLFPLAVQQLDLSGYDLVLSSSHAVAKGVITGPDQVHVSYVHSPMRYAWDLQGEYLRDAKVRGLKGWFVRFTLHWLRQWDVSSANLVDHFIANSSFIARRIRKFYRRDAAVVWPPVDTDYFSPGGAARENFYLAAARMVPYKRLDAILQAFAVMPEKRLVVIGDGPDSERLRAMAPANATFLGSVPKDVLLDHLRRARAEIYAGIEDFGIALAEAQAAGCPLIALDCGGAQDIVRDLGSAAPTGVLFPTQTVEAIVAAVGRFEDNANAITPQACRENALRFSASEFREHYLAQVRSALEAHALHSTSP